MNADNTTTPLSKERIYGPNMDKTILHISQHKSLFSIICWQSNVTYTAGHWISKCINFAWLFIKLILQSMPQALFIRNIIWALRFTVSPVQTMKHQVLPEIFKPLCATIMNKYAIKEQRDLIDSILSNNGKSASVYATKGIQEILKTEQNKLAMRSMDLPMHTITLPTICLQPTDNLKATVIQHISQNIECIEKDMLAQVKHNLEYSRCNLINIEYRLKKLDYIIHVDIPRTTLKMTSNISLKWDTQSLPILPSYNSTLPFPSQPTNVPEIREIFLQQKHHQHCMKNTLYKCKDYLLLRHQHTSFKIHALEQQLNAIPKIAQQTLTFLITLYNA